MAQEFISAWKPMNEYDQQSLIKALTIWGNKSCSPAEKQPWMRNYTNHERWGSQSDPPYIQGNVTHWSWPSRWAGVPSGSSMGHNHIGRTMLAPFDFACWISIVINDRPTHFSSSFSVHRVHRKIWIWRCCIVAFGWCNICRISADIPLLLQQEVEKAREINLL